MRIRIEGQAGRPLAVEVFGLSLSFEGPWPGCPVTVTDSEGGLMVSIGAREDQPEGSPREGGQGVEPLAAPEPDGGQGRELFQELSALRKKVAAEQGVPPYVIFHDNTLREMARALPTDLAAMSLIQGVGKAKLDKYGEMFIAAIREGNLS